MADDKWAILVRIPNLAISSDIRGGVRIERVTFLPGRKIPRLRKKLGIPHPLSEYKKRIKGSYPCWINPDSAYAHIFTRSHPQSDLTPEYRRINDAVYLLASSAYHRSVRRTGAPFGRIESTTNLCAERLMFSSGGDLYRGTKRVSPVGHYWINAEWREFTQHHFFPRLQAVLNGKGTVSPKWRYALRRAGILAGQSLYASRLADAFLCNMIALEVLLSKRGDKFPDALIDRIVALFGWISGEDMKHWQDIITPLYALRCQIVHEGKSDGVRAIHVFNSESLVSNLLRTLCHLTAEITRKDDLIDLSERLKARRVLELPMRERPKGIRFAQLGLQEQYLEENDREDRLHF